MHFDQRTQRVLAGVGPGSNDPGAASGADVATVTVDVGTAEPFVDDGGAGYSGVNRVHTGVTTPDHGVRVATDNETHG